jgi:hypothetical protein
VHNAEDLFDEGDRYHRGRDDLSDERYGQQGE